MATKTSEITEIILKIANLFTDEEVSLEQAVNNYLNSNLESELYHTVETGGKVANGDMFDKTEYDYVPGVLEKLKMLY